MVTGIYVVGLHRNEGEFESGGQKIKYDKMELSCIVRDKEKRIVTKTYKCNTNDVGLVGVKSFPELIGREIMVQTTAKVSNGVAREEVQTVMVMPQQMGGETVGLVFS